MVSRDPEWYDGTFGDDFNEPLCPDCNDTGFVEVDAGGGNSRKQFCACPRGQELAEKDEKARAGEGD